MATITIASGQTVTNWQTTTDAPILRVFYSDTFTSADGLTIVPRGSWRDSNNATTAYKSVTTTLTSNVVTIPTFTIISTRDGRDNSTATVSFHWFASDGTHLGPFGEYTSLQVPALIASTTGCSPANTCCTFADLALYNAPAPPLPQDTYYTATVVDQKITAAVGMASGIHDPGTSGLLSRTALNTAVTRSLAVGSNLSVSNADGTAGNPTISLTFTPYSDPMSTIGDIIIRDASNITARLGIGTANQVLTVTGGVPVWAAAPSGFADPLTTRGDIIYRNSSNATARLAVGSASTVLTSNGTDPAYAQVTNAMLAGSIADTKLSTISTAGKVSDSALSSNIPLLNASPNTFSGKQLFGSAPVNLTGQPFASYRLIGSSDGTSGSPTTSVNPSVVFERFDTATANSISYAFATNRQTGALGSATYNLYLRSVDNDTGVAGHEVGTLYLATGSDVTNNIGGTKALIIDANISSLTSAESLGIEIDVTNRTGATAPILTSSIPTAASVAMFISPIADGSVAGSSGITAGIVFQAATPVQTGIHFSGASIFANRPAIDFKFTTQGEPIRLPNLGANSTGYIYARNNADAADKKLLGLTSSDVVSIDPDGLGVSFGAAATAVFLIGSTSVSTPTLTVSPVSSSTVGELRLLEASSNGVNYVGFKAAASLAANLIWTLPTVDGSANYLLSTDGSGHLSFVPNFSASTATYLTIADETFTLPNSRRILGTASQITVDTSGAGVATFSIPSPLAISSIVGGSGVASTLTLAGTSNGSPGGADIIANSYGGSNVFVVGGTTHDVANFHLEVQNSSTAVLRLVNTNATPAAGGGAGIQSGISALPTAIDQRLAFYTFGASGAVTTTFANGAVISGFSAESWADATTPHGAYIKFETTPVGATSRVQTLIVGRTKTLTDTAVSLFEVALPALGMAGGIIHWTIAASDGTDVQSFTGTTHYALVNKAGTYTKTFSDHTATGMSAKAVSSGTLTAAFTGLDGTNKVTVQITPAGSLTETTYVLYWHLINTSGQAITLV